MPKTMTTVIEVPSGSRPSAMLAWLNKILSAHNMKVLSVTNDEVLKETLKDTPPMFPRGSFIKHVKTQGLYTVMIDPSYARIEATLDPAYGYVGSNHNTATLWIRSQHEMEDGRFELVEQ